MSCMACCDCDKKDLCLENNNQGIVLEVNNKIFLYIIIIAVFLIMYQGLK